jgi:hypothetical protein
VLFLHVFTEATSEFRGHAVVQWLRQCVTNRKVAGSIPPTDVVGGRRTGRKADRQNDEDAEPKADRAQPPTRRKKLKTVGEEWKTGGRPQSVPRAVRLYPFDYSGVKFH